MLLSALLLVLSPVLSAYAAPAAAHDSHDHEHTTAQRLPAAWYQPRGHPVHQLFSRATTDGVSYPAVGTPEWSQGWPQGVPDNTKLPSAWVNALNAAVAAGKIPNIPQSSNQPNQNPVYPQGLNPNSPEICSATYKCRNPEDIWDAPNGTYATSFDDGPQPASATLLDFMSANNVTGTHFMIGTNILNNPDTFAKAFNLNHDIAVHTWTHPYMTTLSNLDVLGQLGYTMQLIHNSTGGRVPRFWRPPYGDSDNRVRAIAAEVFGLQTVVWNQDTNDWAISTNGNTVDKVVSTLTGYLTGPKTPGLIILEHEIVDGTVQAWINAFPMIKANGWNMISLAKIVDGRSYQNAAGSSSDDVEPGDILVGDENNSTDTSDDGDDSSSNATS
ncbi:glycoside hydrolase/deacetylase [Pluteus cervinus]|uniref:Glycoside hydrolase/deacetylase n=1 Tax=Pluteus cervinus TaxID=181527 RepID=A0ACD3BC39_9AGAR|nr:glycoside hydrolase/deacetylase [Pluteus cervinus]